MTTRRGFLLSLLAVPAAFLVGNDTQWHLDLPESEFKWKPYPMGSFEFNNESSIQFRAVKEKLTQQTYSNVFNGVYK